MNGYVEFRQLKADRSKSPQRVRLPTKISHTRPGRRYCRKENDLDKKTPTEKKSKKNTQNGVVQSIVDGQLSIMFIYIQKNLINYCVDQGKGREGEIHREKSTAFISISCLCTAPQWKWCMRLVLSSGMQPTAGSPPGSWASIGIETHALSVGETSYRAQPPLSGFFDWRSPQHAMSTLPRRTSRTVQRQTEVAILKKKTQNLVLPTMFRVCFFILLRFETQATWYPVLVRLWLNSHSKGGPASFRPSNWARNKAHTNEPDDHSLHQRRTMFKNG